MDSYVSLKKPRISEPFKAEGADPTLWTCQVKQEPAVIFIRFTNSLKHQCIPGTITLAKAKNTDALQLL